MTSAGASLVRAPWWRQREPRLDPSSTATGTATSSVSGRVGREHRGIVRWHYGQGLDPDGWQLPADRAGAAFRRAVSAHAADQRAGGGAHRSGGLRAGAGAVAMGPVGGRWAGGPRHPFAGWPGPGVAAAGQHPAGGHRRGL